MNIVACLLILLGCTALPILPFEVDAVVDDDTTAFIIGEPSGGEALNFARTVVLSSSIVISVDLPTRICAAPVCSSALNCILSIDHANFGAHAPLLYRCYNLTRFDIFKSSAKQRNEAKPDTFGGHLYHLLSIPHSRDSFSLDLLL